MSVASLLIAAGCLAWLACVVGIFWPLISADMRAAVQRGERPAPDVTEMTLMVAGPSIWLAAAGIGFWLKATAA